MSAVIYKFPTRRRVVCDSSLCKRRFITSAEADTPAYCSYACGVEGQPDHSAAVNPRAGSPVTV